MTQEQEDLIRSIPKHVTSELEIEIKNIFPKLFKPEQDVWYISPTYPKWMARFDGKFIYGFDDYGGWFRNKTTLGLSELFPLEKADNVEVAKRMKKEIFRRYGTGDTVQYLGYKNTWKVGPLDGNVEYFPSQDYLSIQNNNWFYKQGIWVEVIKKYKPELTQEEFIERVNTLKFLGSDGHVKRGFNIVKGHILTLLEENKIVEE